jgi:hypothetical protein
MGSQSGKIQETLFTSTAPSGAVFAIVAYRSGEYGVTRNGEPMHDIKWPADKLKECLAEFVRLSEIDLKSER